VDERLHLADDMQELRTEIARLQERVAAADESIADLEGQLAGARQELDDIRSTAVWRHSQGLRRVYGRFLMPLKRRLRAGREKGES
jgi:chromosome segregation ATPase